MSLSSFVRAECGCTIPSPWVEFRFVGGAAKYADANRIYGLTGESISGGPYLVDRNRPVDMPDPDDMPEDGFHLYAAHGRWRLECNSCDRPPLVALSVKLGRALTLLEQAGRSVVTLDELQAVLSDPRVRG